MSKHAQISRADLLYCLHGYGEQGLEQFASALGYEQIDIEPDDHERFIDRAQTAVKFDAEIADNVTVSTPASSIRYYRVREQRLLVESGTDLNRKPEWYEKAKTYHEDREALKVNASAKPPPPAPPLMPWSRLWPFLKLSLGSLIETSKLDIPPIIERLARNETLQNLPRKRRKGWAPKCQIIIDYAEPLLPFWRDFNELLQNLIPLRGGEGLEIIAFHNDDSCWYRNREEWQLRDFYRLPATPMPILILSDLGCTDRSERRRKKWQQLGKRWQRAGCRPIALMPCPSRWWSNELIELFSHVCWDRAVRLPQRLGVRRKNTSTKPDREADGKKLLELLAPAIRIETDLLRAVRYLLPAREADVGSEAAAWNHRHSQATLLAMYLEDEVIEQYRQAFQELDDDLKKRVAERVIAHHALLAPDIRFEEIAYFSDLLGETAPDDVLEFFRRFVKSQDIYGEFTELFLNRGKHLSRRSHDTMYQNKHLAELCAVNWGFANRERLKRGENITIPESLQINQIGWLLAEGYHTQRYTLYQRGQNLYFGAIQSNKHSGLYINGSPLTVVESQSPHIKLDNRVQPIDQLIELPEKNELQLSTDHHEIIIDSIEKPSWAEAIGRDEKGLFVVWQGEESRAYWRLVDLSDNGTTANGHFDPPQWADKCDEDEYGFYADFSIKSITQRIRWIEPGEFLMGSPESEPERYDNETQHKVILTNGFWLADTACTQSLWQMVMGDNPSKFKNDDNPVEYISWDDAQEFIKRLNDILPGDDFRLPTEAEWEYACRAGTTTPFWFGEQITAEQVNYERNRGKTAPVKELPCNDWGLYQMHGNVWEWCLDWFGDYPTDTAVDPIGPDTGDFRVLRGGCWAGNGWFVRSADRYRDSAGNRLDGYGLRLARGQTGR